MLSEASIKLLEVSAAVLGLGLLDSLNPFSIAAMVLVLTGKRPLALGGVFIGTTFIILLVAGFVLLEGWAAILKQIIPLIPPWAIDIGLVLLGITCLGAAWFMWRDSANSAAPILDIIRSSAMGTALFAASSTISDLPTALPYFAAVHILAEAKLASAETAVLLVAYNLCYVLPLALLLGVKISGGERIDQGFENIKKWVDWSFRYLVPPLTACLGLFCLWSVAVAKL